MHLLLTKSQHVITRDIPKCQLKWKIEYFVVPLYFFKGTIFSIRHGIEMAKFHFGMSHGFNCDSSLIQRTPCSVIFEILMG